MPLATSPHTTHQLSLHQIHYRHHPFCGCEVEVVRTLHRSGAEVVMVKVPGGVERAIPSWMLDPIQCRELPQEAHPRVSLAALLELLGLIQSQPLPGACGAAQTEGTNATQTKERLLSDQPHLPQEGSVGTISRIQSLSLPRTDGAVVALCGTEEPKSNPEAK